MVNPAHPTHSRSRRRALQVGGLGLFGLSLADVERLAEGAATTGSPSPRRSVLLIYLPGGLSHIDSFDPKPLASDKTRGDFDVIQTRIPDLRICEHLPLLASRSDRWSLVRSFGHPTNDHTQAHHYVLCGKMELPSPFDRAKPAPSDFPSMTAVAGSKLETTGPLPSAAMLPRLLINVARQVRGGQTAGRMGDQFDPWLLKAAANCNQYGSCPDCFMFSNMTTHKHSGFPVLRAPNPQRPQDVTIGRLDRRSNLLNDLEQQQRQLDRFASVQQFGRQRERALSLLTSQKVRDALDVEHGDPRLLARYGNDLFGKTLLLSKRLIENGVRMVQAHLGRGVSWDTHGDNFPMLKNKLLPPFDRALSALIDDLDESGMLETTLVVVCSEFGRTPKISRLERHYKLPGRDHWGATQSMLMAGGGVAGGRVIGETDRIGAYPVDQPVTPQNLAATLYQTLGIPRSANWHDLGGRPYHVYEADPIAGLN
ncbi:MAG: DUF1501 domain-containing protein [Planctomycetales bacterium]|nr:DUF1501 domain-containing protein [Planctomycetales bacterium]